MEKVSMGLERASALGRAALLVLSSTMAASSPLPAEQMPDRQVGIGPRTPTRALSSVDLLSHPSLSAGGSEATRPPVLSHWAWRAAEAFSLPAPALLLGCPQVPIPPRLSQILPVSAPSLINVSATSATRAVFFLGPSASYIPLFQADSDGKKQPIQHIKEMKQK